MMKSLFILIAILLGLNLSGQSDFHPGNSIKCSLTDLITVTGSSFLLSYEQPFTERYSLQLEGGYAIGPNYGFFENSQTVGYKLRSDLRFYLNGGKTSFEYIGIQLLYHHLNGNAEEVFCRDGCNYFQQLEYKKTFSNKGIHFAYGFNKFISKKIIFELETSFGVRMRKQYNKNIPEDAELIETEGFGVLGEGDFLLPAIGFQMRFGFAL